MFKTYVLDLKSFNLHSYLLGIFNIDKLVHLNLYFQNRVKILFIFIFCSKYYIFKFQIYIYFLFSILLSSSRSLTKLVSDRSNLTPNLITKFNLTPLNLYLDVFSTIVLFQFRFSPLFHVL